MPKGTDWAEAHTFEFFTKFARGLSAQREPEFLPPGGLAAEMLQDPARRGKNRSELQITKWVVHKSVLFVVLF